MQTNSALEAQYGSLARRPSGLRRLSLAMLAAGRAAEDFKGSPAGQGATRPGQVLAAFKAAAPHLGFGPRIVHAIDWLFTFTQPQDWLEGSRPIVWPSAALQRDALGHGLTQTKALNRRLVELGLITMKDSPNGKRYGKRDGKGRILEAYGFDLSPLFTRMAEFQAAAEEGRALRDRMRQLRRRATIARNGLLQILETVAELGLSDPTWQQLETEGRALARSLKSVERVEEMEFGVSNMERRQLEARDRLESQLPAAVPEASEAVDSDPLGAEIRPHQYSYNSSSNSNKNTVLALEKSKARMASASHQTPPIEPAKGRMAPSERNDRSTVLRINTDELVRLAPRLRPYLHTASPGWSDIIEAADWLRHDLEDRASVVI